MTFTMYTAYRVVAILVFAYAWYNYDQVMTMIRFIANK